MSPKSKDNTIDINTLTLPASDICPVCLLEAFKDSFDKEVIVLTTEFAADDLAEVAEANEAISLVLAVQFHDLGRSLLIVFTTMIILPPTQSD